jgi:glycosyltransferase involved in cell wall biosynthesis
MQSGQILVITNIPSPYNVEYFDSIAKRIELRAVYLRANDRARKWGFVPPHHECLFLDLTDDAEARFSHWVDQADFVIFSGYWSHVMRNAMSQRCATGRPWCYWGERLGFHGLGWLGMVARRFVMRELHRSHAPVWAMGSWAIESYRREFASERQYLNIPYCSDLTRFRTAGEQRASANRVRFLYSGSLIHRKGVDLLCHAFKRLAQQLRGVHLTVIGHGPLRAQMESILSPVSDRVVFVGPVEWNGLPACYAQADFLCAPSRYDGWGLIVPEGLASGLPVIATDRMGAAGEIIQSGNGWKVPAGDEEALYRAMLEAAMMKPVDRRGMSESAKSAAEPYDLPAGTDRFLGAVRLSLGESANAATMAA